MTQQCILSHNIDATIHHFSYGASIWRALYIIYFTLICVYIFNFTVAIPVDHIVVAQKRYKHQPTLWGFRLG